MDEVLVNIYGKIYSSLHYHVSAVQFCICAYVSTRSNIRYNPSDKLNFRLSYSTGFRAPQAFDEDFHIAIVGGERVVTVLADDLKEESSHSFSFSADWYPTIGKTKIKNLSNGVKTQK